LNELLKENMKEIPKQKALSISNQKNFGVAKLRLIPKSNTFRPITTFNRKVPQTNPNQVQNNNFYRIPTSFKFLNSHLVLRNMKEKMIQQKLGCPVFEYQYIQKKFLAFAQEWKNNGMPPLYFVTMDIEKCYDNVICEKLKTFLSETNLLEKEYFILKFLSLRRKNTVIDKKKRRKFGEYFRHKINQVAVDGNDYSDFQEMIDSRDDINLENNLCIDIFIRKRMTKVELLEPIYYICNSNFVSFNKKYYLQTKGIPQGLSISYILSSFYYSILEKQSLKFLEENNNGLNLLMRLTDDYLFVTSSKENANNLIENMLKLSENNDFKINYKKLKTNFPIDPKTLMMKQLESFSEDLYKDFCDWIGISIQMSTLQIKPLFKLETAMKTLNLNIVTKRARLWLKRKLKSFLMNNIMHYFNKALNSEEFMMDVMREIVEISSHKFVKCSEAYKRLSQSQGAKKTEVQLAGVILDTIRDFQRYISKNAPDVIILKDCDYIKKECLKGILEVFSKRKSFFPILCKILNKHITKLTISRGGTNPQLENRSLSSSSRINLF